MGAQDGNCSTGHLGLAGGLVTQPIKTSRIVNTSSSIPLPDIKSKLNPHIEMMNSKNWELFSVIQQTIGIHEVLVMFWRKTVYE